MLYLKHHQQTFKHIIFGPIILTVIIPMVIMDAWVEIYHHLCFPLYGLPLVPRKNYVRIDRHKLSYLTWMQKIFCVYCGYANGLTGYWVKIAGDTEKYWCGIKHREGNGFIPPSHHQDFAKYGDKEDFTKKYLS